MIAAQMFEAASAAIPELPSAIAAGDFAPLFAWLAARVHGQGSLLSTAELVESATGSPLGTASFERHLRRRYLDGRNEPL
jgi:carboxypeptidase Taq